MQDRNLYTNNERSSPTVAISSFFTLISIAAAGNKKHMNFDYAQAFLNADMKNEVHIQKEENRMKRSRLSFSSSSS